MASFVTSLPTRDHDGLSTLDAVYAVVTHLRVRGVIYSIVPNCKGLWYDGDDLYSDDTIVIEMDGDREVIRQALARYGEAARQYEVLCVECKRGYVVERAEGYEAAVKLARKHGGATLYPNGVAVAFKYASLVHGRDYVSTVTGAMR